MKQLLLFLLLLTCSCVSVERASKVMQKHPLELAELCSTQFPVTEEVIQGETITITDTVEVPGPVMECPETTNPETGEVYRPVVKCPGTKTILQTVTRVDTIIRENTSRIKGLELKLTAEGATREKETARADKAEATATKRGWWLAGLTVLFFASVAMWIRPKI